MKKVFRTLTHGHSWSLVYAFVTRRACSYAVIAVPYRDPTPQPDVHLQKNLDCFSRFSGQQQIRHMAKKSGKLVHWHWNIVNVRFLIEAPKWANNCGKFTCFQPRLVQWSDRPPLQTCRLRFSICSNTISSSIPICSISKSTHSILVAIVYYLTVRKPRNPTRVPSKSYDTAINPLAASWWIAQEHVPLTQIFQCSMTAKDLRHCPTIAAMLKHKPGLRIYINRA